ncbi:MAG: ABC transporter substrate-binding protein [Pseudomonadota bacterium]
MKPSTPVRPCTNSLIRTIVLVLALMFYHHPCHGESGVSQQAIILGQSCALSGPAGDLGSGMKAGLETAFDEINARGGIQGRHILLYSMDDYYEPGQASRNTEFLILHDNVFMLVGHVGTPTSKASLPIAQARNVPFFAPFTGARFLREPFCRTVINIRSGYDEEMMHMISHLVKARNIRKIACFYQDDSFGKASLDSVERALAAHDLTLTARGSFQRNTVAVMAGLKKIQQACPQAVVLVGPHPPCAEFIKLAVARGMDATVFCALSFAGVNALNQALGPMPQDIIVSQVMPFPWDESLPIIRDFHGAVATWRPRTDIDYSSFEGYVAGRLFCHIAQGLTAPPTRESFIAALENARSFNLGGIAMEFGPLDHQGMNQTYLILLQNGVIKPLNGLDQ